MREVEYPPGTRYKDRDAINELLKALEIDDDRIIELIELALAAGDRRVPKWVRGRS
jgi:hypothetical protein